MNRSLVIGFAALVFACHGPARAQAPAAPPAAASPGSDLVPYRKGKLWGYATRARKIVIPLQFADAELFSEGLAVVTVKQAKGYARGYIDPTGKLVIPAQYQYADAFEGGLAPVSVGGKYGYINKAGIMVVAPKYALANGFSEGLAAVQLGGKWGYVDSSGREVTPIKYDQADRVREGFAPVFIGDSLKNQQRCGYIDKSGREAIALDYFACNSFSEGLAHVRRPVTWDGGGNILDGFINSSGAYAIPLSADFYLAFDFHDGWAVVGDHYIDKSGKTVFSPAYEDVSEFSEGLAKVSRGDKYGYIDKSGKLVIPLTLDDAGLDSILCGDSDFHQGRAAIRIKDKCGFIDTVGKLVIPAKYGQTLSFQDGLAYITNGDDSGFIAPDGTEYFEN